jgi:hypothetical protein
VESEIFLPSVTFVNIGQSCEDFRRDFRRELSPSIVVQSCALCSLNLGVVFTVRAVFQAIIHQEIEFAGVTGSAFIPLPDCFLGQGIEVCFVLGSAGFGTAICARLCRLCME